MLEAQQLVGQAKQFESLSPISLKRLLEISAKLTSTLHLEELLSLVMEVAIELTETQTASILLLDQKTNQLHFAASTGGAMPADISVPLDNSIAGWVVRNGRSFISNDVQADNRFYAAVDRNLRFVTQSMLAVPLMTNEKAIGALEVLNKRNNIPYTEQDVSLMEALASQSAVAIMNARLFSQSDLLAEIMHEIKTPIMAIHSASELLMRPNLPEEYHGKLVEMIRKESTRLSKMTKDFLDFARLESGRTRLIREPIDVPNLIKEIVPIAQPQATERNIHIITDVPEVMFDQSDSMALIGDYDRLKQVLLNLVSNAVKYNVPNGSVTIEARVNGEKVCLAVRDTGHGIASEDQDHLFERFYRIPSSEGVSEGTGLGLSVAKKIVEEHNGRIEVASMLGKGTTFSIYLPLTAVA